MRHKTKRFKSIVPYVLDDKGRVDPENTFTIFHNLRSTEPDEIVQEFETQDSYRRKIKNGVLLYHEVLSFSTEQNKADFSVDKLQDLAQQYIQLRGHKALCLSKCHIENDNVHIHCIFSGTEYKSQKTLRLDNKRFKEIRLQMEEYQKAKYPEFDKSIVYLDTKEKSKELGEISKSEPERQLEKRSGKQSDKEIIRNLLVELYKSADSEDDFLKKIVDKDIEIYKYRQKVSGIRFNNRKYRFSKLGIEDEHLKILNRSYDRLKELEILKAQKELRSDKGRGRELSR